MLDGIVDQILQRLPEDNGVRFNTAFLNVCNNPLPLVFRQDAQAAEALTGLGDGTGDPLAQEPCCIYQPKNWDTRLENEAAAFAKS